MKPYPEIIMGMEQLRSAYSAILPDSGQSGLSQEFTSEVPMTFQYKEITMATGHGK